MQLTIPKKEFPDKEGPPPVERIIIPKKEESIAKAFKTVIFSFKITEEKITIIIGQR